MPSRFAIFLSCCIALLQPVPAAGARWRHFDVDDGLPQNSAVAMTVDRHGLLWVGTEDGLARFDGERFVAFDRAVERAWLPGNYIVALASDAHSVWIAAESGGLSRFDLDSERFERIAAKDPDTGAELNIWSITVDRNVLWIGTRDRGLLALDRHEPTRVVAHWHADAPAGHRLALRAVRHVAVDHRGDGVWVAGTGGLAHIANGHGDARNEELAGIDMGQSEPDVASIVSRGDGSLWLGLRSQGVVRRRAGERQFERIALSAADQPEMLVVNQLAEAAPGVLMAATDRGLYVLDRSCDCFHPAPSSSPLRQSLEQSLMLSVVATTDVVWAGSWNRGLFRFDPRAPGFDLLTPADLAGRGEPTPPRALYVDRRQRLWVGSFGAGVHFASISERPMARWAWQQWRGSEDTRDHQVWAFAESRSGDLFIGSDAGLTAC